MTDNVLSNALRDLTRAINMQTEAMKIHNDLMRQLIREMKHGQEDKTE